MIRSDRSFVTLSAAGTELCLDATPGQEPRVVHWGRSLPNTEREQLRAMSTRQWVFGGANVDLEPTLSTGIGQGFLGSPGFLAHRSGRDWATNFKLVSATEKAANIVEMSCQDEPAKIDASYRLELNEHGVLTASVVITNKGDEPLTIDWCAPLTLPIDPRMTKLKCFSGRWAAEFQHEDVSFRRGSFLKENRAGRTGHDGFPAIIAMHETTSESLGECTAVHLAWSGNNRVRADRPGDGRALLQLGELLLPGEVILEPGESYESPGIAAAWSESGLNGLSQKLHSHLRNRVLDHRTKDKPRPVHYNTWEAVYFDHSDEKLKELADNAAAVGAERFVLDDGWFGERRNDEAGLGDWTVSTAVYPEGLHKLANHVRSLGMEFGIWFEPEMVNPNSDLYRRHPDWVLQASSVDQIPFRNQLTLDLSREEVSDYLFEAIDRIVEEYGVSYIKWDMNRDIHHPGGQQGRSVVHAQTRGVYRLIQRLRDKHASLEIESCSSGGARTDYGVLQHTDRIWTSDNNDALERQSIQRGGSYFFPLEVMGSHVGPKVCHITGRTLDMAFRVGTAIFGHMGMEVDLSDEDPRDLAVLKRGISLYKEHRHLLHSGRMHRLETTPDFMATMVVAPDLGEALASCAKVASHRETLPDRLRFAGLDPDSAYRVKLVWPDQRPTLTEPSVLDVLDLQGEGTVLSGEALLHFGLQLPWTFPNSCLIFHLLRVGTSDD